MVVERARGAPMSFCLVRRAGNARIGTMQLDATRARSFIDGAWKDSILPALVEYVRIPNKSPAFDRDWASAGHMEKAIRLAEDWARRNAPTDARIEVVSLPQRTPVLVVEVPGTAPGEVLLYGHLDKQPEMEGWEDGLGPWEPVVRDDRLFGRGGADDGYALFSSLTAIRALQEQGIAHPRCFVLIECCEEICSSSGRHQCFLQADAASIACGFSSSWTNTRFIGGAFACCGFGSFNSALIRPRRRCPSHATRAGGRRSA